MKKLVCLLLVVAMMSASLVSCGMIKEIAGEAVGDIVADLEQGFEDVQNGIMSDIMDAIEDKVEDKIEDEVENNYNDGRFNNSDYYVTETADVVEPEIEMPIEDKEITRGTIDGDVYTNEYLGFQFTKPSTWYYSTDEEMAALMNMSVDMFLDERYKVLLENNPAIYDMRASDAVTGSGIFVIYENLEKSFATNITEEQYIDAVKRQLAAADGFTVDMDDEVTVVKLGETEFKRVCSTMTAYGTKITQVYYIRKTGEYMASVLISIMGDYTLNDIEAMFK